MQSDPEQLFKRRVQKVLPSKASFLKLLKSGKKIRLYQGFDPTGSRLHLGHTIGLRKLMEFARAGHEVIFLFGTGTVLVGDPSERDTGRKLITQEEINQNIKTWKDQVKPLVDFSLVKVVQNGDWLTKLTLKEIIQIASNISAIQLFKRDSFQRRIKKGDTVWYHETMYPLLQGYDSVVLDVDLEIGGTDQEFNMLIGRELQRKINHKEKYVLTVPMIMGTDGKQMSKSSGNCIWLNDSPDDIYGKIMRLPDNQISSYWHNLTDLPTRDLESKINSDPLNTKKTLARDITQQLHGSSLARLAESKFEAVFQQGKTPDTPTPLSVSQSVLTILDLCRHAGVGESNSQIKRTISQGGVEINGQKITLPTAKIKLHSGDILRFGKRYFFQVKVHKSSQN